MLIYELNDHYGVPPVMTHESDCDYYLLYSLFLQAHVEQWIDFATLEIDTNILRWFIPRIGFAVYLPPVCFCCSPVPIYLDAYK